MKRFVFSTVLLAVALIGTACGGGTAPPTSTPTDTAPAPTNTAPPATETLAPPTDTPLPATPTDVPSTSTQAPTPTEEPATATPEPTATDVPATATEPAPTATETSAAAEESSPTPMNAESSNGEPDGVQVFNTMGCGTCHTLDAAGTSGQVGPELNRIGARAAERIASEEYTGDATTAEGYIRESLLSPNAHVVAGYPENVMPPNFEDRISDDQLNALVEFLMTQK